MFYPEEAVIWESLKSFDNHLITWCFIFLWSSCAVCLTHCEGSPFPLFLVYKPGISFPKSSLSAPVRLFSVLRQLICPAKQTVRV